MKSNKNKKLFESNNIKVKEWTRHFKRIFEEETIINIENKENDNIIIPKTKDELLDYPISKSEVKQAFEEIKNGKAVGIDGIPGEFYKKIAENSEILENIKNLINIIFEQRSWPKAWETGVIVPIYKESDANQPENYRPNTLLPILSKIVTNILGKRLQT